MAGCGQACFLVAAIMYPTLLACTSVATLIHSSQYLDDVTRVGRGTKQAIVEDLPKVGATFLAGVHYASLVESGTKSCVLASSPGPAAAISDKLKQLTGKALPVVTVGKDVGFNYAAVL